MKVVMFVFVNVCRVCACLPSSIDLVESTDDLCLYIAISINLPIRGYPRISSIYHGGLGLCFFVPVYAQGNNNNNNGLHF